MKGLFILLLVGIAAYLIYDKMNQPEPKPDKTVTVEEKVNVPVMIPVTVTKFDRRGCMFSLREKVITLKDSRVVPVADRVSELKDEFEKISPDQRCRQAMDEMMKISRAINNSVNHDTAPPECFEPTRISCKTCLGTGVIRYDRGRRKMPGEKPCDACDGKGKIPGRAFSNFKAVTAFGNRCGILITYLNDQLDNPR